MPPPAPTRLRPRLPPIDVAIVRRIVTAVAVAFAITTLHILGLYVLSVALSKHSVEQSGARKALAGLATFISCLGYLTWYWQSARTRASRAATAAVVLASSYAPIHFLTPTQGDLTKEELLFFFVLGTSVGFYVVWYCVVAARFVLATRKVWEKWPKRRVAIGVIVALFVLRSFTQAVIGVEDTSSFANAGSNDTAHRFERGILGRKFNLCPKGTTMRRPTVWQSIMPRRLFSFHMGPEYCELQVALPFNEPKPEQRTVKLPETTEPDVPAVSYLDERTGLLYVVSSCNRVLGQGPDAPPRVLAVDTRTNMLAHIHEHAIRPASRDDLRDHHVHWMAHVRRSFGYHSSNALRETYNTTVQGSTWRVRWQEQFFTVASASRPKQFVPAQGSFEGVSNLQAYYDDLMPLPAAAIVSRMDDVAQFEREQRAANSNYTAPERTAYDDQVSGGLRSWLLSVRVAGFDEVNPDVYAIALATAHTIVQCGKVEEHHAYPVELRGPVTIKRAAESTVGVAITPVSATGVPNREATFAAKAPRDRHRVVVLLVDSVSRVAAVDMLPRTVQWIRSRQRDASGRQRWYEFPGLTTIGHSTQPNLGGFMSGLHGDKDDALLHKHNLFEAINPQDKAAASERHTRTQVVNGMCSSGPANHLHFERRVNGSQTMGTGFGASSGPIDDYMTSIYCDHESGVLFSNFVGPYSMRRRCFGRTPDARLGLTYSRASYVEVTRRRQEAFFQLTILLNAHEGSRSVLSTIDDDVVHHLEALEAMGALEESTFLLLGDHGAHMGPWFELTDAGRAERAVPMFLMQLPPSKLVTRDDEATQWGGPASEAVLTRNQDLSLLTPYDVHATWRDLLGLPPLVVPADATHPKPNGRSVLRAMTPHANCRDAGAADGPCAQDLLCG